MNIKEIIKDIEFDLYLLKIKQNGIDMLLSIKEQVSNNRSELKKYKGDLLDLQTLYNKDLMTFQKNTSIKIFNRLMDLEKYKVNGFLPDEYALEVKKLFLLLYDYGGRLNSRYVKMPADWPYIGIHAGILEDLIVVLRTPSQIGLGNKHLYSIDELIEGFKKFLDNELLEGKTFPRFMFLTSVITPNLFKHYAILLYNDLYNDNKSIENILNACISSQNNSQRIGIYKDANTTYYYAIQGVVGNIELDSRVTKVLTVDNAPNYAVHFTKNKIAQAIWNKDETKITKLTDRKETTPGSICKFERPIHALTNILLEDGSYKIFNVDKDIRNRMAHGIKDDVERPKYQAGLVIDVKKLVSLLAPGTVLTNELGTLLVYDDIPHECLLHCIISDDDIETFWKGTK